MASPFLPGAVPPTELPLVATPAPKFDEVGAQLTKGLRAKGFWAGLWEGLLDVVQEIASRVFILAMGGMSYAAAYIARTILKAEAKSDPAFQRLAEVAIEDLFGVKVDMSVASGPGGRGARTAAANAIGHGVLEGLFGQFTGSRAGVTEPSAEGAEKFLSVTTQLALEGWLEGWMFEALSLGAMEKFADLDDIMAQILGLGRLSRRVMGPPCDVFITQPFTWKLNQTYRPNLLGSAELIRQFLRGRCTRERLFKEMAMAGFKDDDIEALLVTHQKFLADADLAYLTQHEVWTDEEAVQHLRDSGYSETLAKATLALEWDKKIDVYRRQMADVFCDAYVRRDIEEDQLRTALSGLELPESDQLWMRRVAGIKREFRTKDLSMSDVEAAVKRNILTIADFRAYCLKQGYSLADSMTLELLLLSEVKDKAEADKAKEDAAKAKAALAAAKAAEQAARRAQIEAEQKARGVSLGQFEAMVRAGLRTIEQYREFLRGLKYAAEDVTALSELLAGQIDQRRQELEQREKLRAAAAKKRVSLSDLERAVKRGLMSVDEYRSQLAVLGFGDEDRNLLAQLLQGELDDAAEALRRREAAAAALAVRKVSLEDLERAVRLGLRSMDAYRARLVAEGFSSEDAELLARLLQSVVDADDAARKRRAEIEAALKKRKVSLSEMEQAVRAGVASMAAYRTLLAREGYSEEDAALLEGLLEFEIDAAAAAAKKRAETEARLAERRISLADVQRAVKLGILTLGDYRAVLKREGFPLEDQDILVSMLTAELAEVRAAEARRRAAETAAAKKKISLADLERAVRAGVRSIQEYQGELAALGFSPQDQGTLVALLGLEIAQDTAARLKREQAETTLRARGLSLSQMERAVREGLVTLRAYEAWLKEQGYGVEDVAILSALLEYELEEQAAKQQAQAP